MTTTTIRDEKISISANGTTYVDNITPGTWEARHASVWVQRGAVVHQVNFGENGWVCNHKMRGVDGIEDLFIVTTGDEEAYFATLEARGVRRCRRCLRSQKNGLHIHRVLARVWVESFIASNRCYHDETSDPMHLTWWRKIQRDFLQAYADSLTPDDDPDDDHTDRHHDRAQYAEHYRGLLDRTAAWELLSAVHNAGMDQEIANLRRAGNADADAYARELHIAEHVLSDRFQKAAKQDTERARFGRRADAEAVVNFLGDHGIRTEILAIGPDLTDPDGPCGSLYAGVRFDAEVGGRVRTFDVAVPEYYQPSLRNRTGGRGGFLLDWPTLPQAALDAVNNEATVVDERPGRDA